MYLNNYNLTLAVDGLYVHTVELVVAGILVAFALQYLVNGYLLAEKYGKQTFKHTEIGLVAEHPLGSPVESYEFVISVHILLYLLLYL